MTIRLRSIPNPKLGSKQAELIGMLLRMNEDQLSPKSNTPPWSKAGWVRISKSWTSLKSLTQKKYVQTRYYKSVRQKSAEGWQARITESGKKALTDYLFVSNMKAIVDAVRSEPFKSLGDTE